MVTARFKISRVIPYGTDNLDEAAAAEVEMTPDYANGANSEWCQATPAGVVRLTITNMAAVRQLPQGKSVNITFEVVD